MMVVAYCTVLIDIYVSGYVFPNIIENCKNDAGIVGVGGYEPLDNWPENTNGILLFLLNTLRPRQNGHHFAADIFKCIFLNENDWILIKISLKFVPSGPINNIAALVQIMAWRRPGDKPLSEPMMISLLTHICVTRPQWVNILWPSDGL